MSFSIAGGPSFATGDFGDLLDMGYHAQVGAGFSLPMLPIGIRADGAWNRFDIENTDENVRILSGTLNAVVNLPTPGITPYLIGGVGLYNGKNSGGGDSVTDFGVNVGAGVRVGLPGLSVFGEARLHNVFGDPDTYRFVPVSIGISL